jgi:hypothetical protein
VGVCCIHAKKTYLLSSKSVVHTCLSIIKTAGHLHPALDSNREGSSARPLLTTIMDMTEDTGREVQCAATIGMPLLHLPAVRHLEMAAIPIVHHPLPQETQLWQMLKSSLTSYTTCVKISMNTTSW